jgi:16S rRNA (guanine527-N7)-methyltransferase
MKNHIERVVARARREGLHAPDGAPERLGSYISLVLKFGEKFSLLSRADLSALRIAKRHIADSLGGLLVATPSPGARVLDYGAGAGLVGVVWAIVRPDLAITLLESRRKKCAFLLRAVADLGLASTAVWEGRGEDAGARAGSFDLVASRGVATDEEALGAFAGLLRPEGAVLFFKGPESARAAAERVRGDARFLPPVESIRLLGEGKKRIYLLARRA